MLIEKTVCYMRIFRWVNVTWSYLLFCCFPVDRIFFFPDNLHHSRCHSSVTECMTFVICDQQVFIGCRNVLFFFLWEVGVGGVGRAEFTTMESGVLSFLMFWFKFCQSLIFWCSILNLWGQPIGGAGLGCQQTVVPLFVQLRTKFSNWERKSIYWH